MQARLTLPLALLAFGALVGCSDDPPEVPLCTSDAECRTGERCAPDGQCVFGAECVVDQECIDADARTTCDLEAFECVFREGFGDECDASRPCAFGQFCSELLGRCLDANSARDCVRRSQCPANQICDRNANKCIPDPGCYSDAFCEDGEVCDLVNQVCRSVALECSSCFGTGTCEVAGDLCFVDTQECLPSGAQPECNPGELCDPLGRCVQCTRSADCGPGLFCNVAVGRCESNVQCADDPSLCPMSAEVTCITCEDPESCNPRTRRCEAPPEPCSTDIDCPSDQICDLAQDPPICVPRIPDCLDDLFDDAASNDTVAAASLLAPDAGPRFEELKACPGDEDWYRFDVTAGTYLTVDARFAHDDGDLDMQLFLADGRTLLDESRSVTDNERVELEVGTDLSVYARVFYAMPSVNPVPYELIVARDPGDLCPDDANEPDDGRESAKPLLSDQPYEGRLCSADPDWFVLSNLPAGSQVTVELDFVDNLGDLDLELYRADQTQPLLTSEGIEDGERITFDAPFGGDFFLRVFGKAADTNVYSIRATVREGLGGGCLDDVYEPNDSPMGAVLTASTTVADLTLCKGDEDWFRFTLQPGQAAEVEIGFEAGADLELKVYEGMVSDPDVTPTESSVTTNPREYVALRSFTGGDFFVRVHGHTEDDISPYQLRVRITDFGLCQPDIADVSGLGNDMATAFGLSLPPTRLDDLSLCTGDTEDWYRIFAAGGFMNVLRVNYVPDDGQIDFELLDATGRVLFDSTNLAQNAPRTIQINVPGTPGSYAQLFVRVFPTFGFDPKYNLTLDLVPIYSCFPDAAEANETRPRASEIASSTVSPMLFDLTLCPGTRNVLTGAGDTDWFILRPPAAGARIDAEISFTQGDLLMELLSPNDGPRACINAGGDRCYSDGNGLSERISFTATTTDPYYLRVDSVFSSPNVTVRPPDADTPYQLSIEYTMP